VQASFQLPSLLLRALSPTRCKLRRLWCSWQSCHQRHRLTSRTTSRPWPAPCHCVRSVPTRSHQCHCNTSVSTRPCCTTRGRRALLSCSPGLHFVCLESSLPSIFRSVDTQSLPVVVQSSEAASLARNHHPALSAHQVERVTFLLSCQAALVKGSAAHTTLGARECHHCVDASLPPDRQ
jgi:hypothetical protein